MKEDPNEHLHRSLDPLIAHTDVVVPLGRSKQEHVDQGNQGLADPTDGARRRRRTPESSRAVREPGKQEPVGDNVESEADGGEGEVGLGIRDLDAVACVPSLLEQRCRDEDGSYSSGRSRIGTISAHRHGRDVQQGRQRCQQGCDEWHAGGPAEPGLCLGSRVTSNRLIEVVVVVLFDWCQVRIVEDVERRCHRG
jgi:hypothetical protein